MRTVLCLTASALLAGAAACAQSAAPVEQGPPNVPGVQPRLPRADPRPGACARASTSPSRPSPSGLEHPWGIALLPDGGYLVTERPGRLRVVARRRHALRRRSRACRRCVARGQGGLLDVAVSPTFAEDRIIYWTYAKPMARRTLRHRRGARPAGRGRRIRHRRAGRLRAGPAVAAPPTTTARASSRTVRATSSSPPANTRPRRAAARPGSRHDLRQGRPHQPRRHPAGGQSLRRPGRRRPDHLVPRPPQHPGRGPRRRRPALDRRARAQGWRRAEPHRAGRELRLAGDQLRRELRRLAGRRGHHRRARGWSSRATTGTR